MAVKAIVVNNRFIHKKKMYYIYIGGKGHYGVQQEISYIKMYYIYIGGYGVQQEKDRYLYINTSITLCYLKGKKLSNP